MNCGHEVLIGTAGHVDHGKSALVEALTGINPMHLPEEFRRDLTIELGFAHLRHPHGYTIGFVDVPGHEKLVRTMISGASGFQIALWVVDAREGLMPQSLEHLNILQLLGVWKILPIITKADLATEEQIGQTRESIEQKLGTAPRIHVVDSVSRRGIPELLQDLFALCTALKSDSAGIDGLGYPPIDRCFVLNGVGTILTGTLARGTLRQGGSVSVSSRPGVYRIRSLHNHYTTAESINPGQRAGVHLHGLKAEHIHRGDTLVSTDYPYRSRRLNVQVTFLPQAQFSWRPGIRALFLAAAFEMECRLWGLVKSAEETWMQIQLPREACFYFGQRFILRSTNPMMTIGGGVVCDIAPDRPRRVTAPERVRAQYIELSGPVVFELSSLARKWMCAEEDLLKPGLRTASGMIWHEKLHMLAAEKVGGIVAQAGSEPAEWSFQALAALLKISDRHVKPLLETVLASSALAPKGVLHLTSSTLVFDPRQGGLSEPEHRVADGLLNQLYSAGLQPLRLPEYCAAMRVDKKMFDKAVAMLVKQGRIVRIDMEFAVDRGIWEDFKERVRRMPPEGFTASEFGKYFGLSRKYSVPYLESLNRAGTLQRQGDRHRLRIPS